MKWTKKKIIVNIIIFALVLLPLWMYLAWVLMPRKHLRVFISDKTVLTNECREHRSLNWLLLHKKYIKDNNEFYKTAEDYFGFFPLPDKKFNIRDLSKYNDLQIDSLAKHYQMAYYSDTYGIYSNEWYRDTLINEHSNKVYGGLDKQDYLFLTKIKEQKKLAILEFNTIASPTSKNIRIKLEELFKIRWSGWIGRYFNSLDTLKTNEIPKWVIRNYLKQHNNLWKFKKSGIVFVNEDETIVILENQTHLNNEIPNIYSYPKTVDKYNVIPQIKFNYWFDITWATDTSNHVLSYFKISTNHKGDSILSKYNIPAIFPAVIEHTTDYKFFYFCGDFCDNPVDNRMIRLRGIKFFKLFTLDVEDPNNHAPFFWLFYKPIMQQIIEDYYKNLK